MTANAFEEDRKRALEVGMDGYIAKPIHMESVLDALQEGLAGKHLSLIHISEPTRH